MTAKHTESGEGSSRTGGDESFMLEKKGWMFLASSGGRNMAVEAIDAVSETTSSDSLDIDAAA